MSVIFVVLPLSLLFVLGAIIAFIWSVHSGQMDDLETPSMRLLLDDADKSPHSHSCEGE